METEDHMKRAPAVLVPAIEAPPSERPDQVSRAGQCPKAEW